MAVSSAKPLREPSNRVPPSEDASEPAVVVVVRLPEPGRRFGREIRRLSTIVLERSREDFVTADPARAEGQAALDASTGSR